MRLIPLRGPAVALGLVLASVPCARGLAQTLESAFIFGSRDLTCPHPTAAETNYTMVHHAGDNQAAHDALAYDEAVGYGFEVIDPGNTGRSGSAQFGPFDNSPNGRDAFDADACPDELYDSFIGFKNFPQPCDDSVVGSCDVPCVSGDVIPNGPGPDDDTIYEPSGGIFRIDLPNGWYRFVGVFGDPDNAHSHRVLVEDGGAGPPSNLGDNHVVLLENFRQQDFSTGDPQPQALVAFGDQRPPEPDGVGADPFLVPIDENGRPTACAPNSPALEVTQGYIRVHLLQANGGCGADPNGGDIVLFEAWSHESEPTVEPTPIVNRSFDPPVYAPGDSIDVTLELVGIAAATTVTETVPPGFTVSDPGMGTLDGDTLTFGIDTDASLTYTVEAPGGCGDNTFSVQVAVEGTDCAPALSSSPLCDPGPCGIQNSGGVRDLLMIGPIDLGRGAGDKCDDMGNLAQGDYLASADGSVGEANILVVEGDDVTPDFGGNASGAGVLDPSVDADVNADINPDSAKGTLTVWRADANAEGAVNLNDGDNVGNGEDGVDNYLIYSVAYLDNTTGECLDAVLEVGSDDAVKVRMNGALVHVNPVCRGVPAYGEGDMVPVTLAPGPNVVLIAVVESGGGTGVRLAVRNPDGSPLNDGRVVGSCEPPASIPPGAGVAVSRTVEGDRCADPPVFDVTLSVSGNGGRQTTVTETLPECATLMDDGGGQLNGSTLTFDVTSDGDVGYTVDLSGCCPADGDFLISGEHSTDGGCPSPVSGSGTVSCCPFVCEPAPKDPPAELVEAFAFGARDLTCPHPTEPVDYTMVLHDGGPGPLAYDSALGYGFEVIDPGNNGRGGFAQFGPFDDSPNNRNNFGDDCPEEIYDSFIGFKNHAQTCSEVQVGNTMDPCPDGAVLPYPTMDNPDNTAEYLASGGIFRVDVPPGVYRFVAAFGEADNPHASRVIAEDGGTGPPSNAGAGGGASLGENHVVLVENHDQAQFDHGEADPDSCPGCGVFARVGFNCHIPPLGDGAGADPQFVNYGPDGRPVGPGEDDVFGTVDDPPPESPMLEVTQGYVRFHLLQGNANDGPGGKSFDAETGIGDRDPNGTDVVMIELWKVGDVELGTALIPGDSNADGSLDISDGINTLQTLFVNAENPQVCEGIPFNEGGNLSVQDFNGDGNVDISDGSSIFDFLFTGGPPHVLGEACTPIQDCVAEPTCELP